MKILHLNSYDTFGGAAKGMYILHNALIKLGVQSQVLVLQKHSFDNKVTQIYTDTQIKERYNLDMLPLQFYPNRTKHLMSNAIINSSEILEHINRINPDIIHMHWVCHSLLSIEDIKAINQPIIWTMRDMWAFTGGCHHALSCKKYITSCQNCPILNSNEIHDISYQQTERKIKTYKNSHLTFVGISPWIANEAKKSYIIKQSNANIIKIDNNYDSNSFYKIPKTIAQKNLNLSTSKKIISIGAHSLKDEHKGIQYFLDMLKFLNQNDFFIIFFGNENLEIFSEVQFEYLSFGFIEEKTLNNIYNVSDVFVAPSLLEPFGKTIVESLACGTPVVCFEDSGGPDFIISHKVNGYKAKKYDSQDLANGVKWIIQTSYNQLSHNAIKKAAQFSDKKIASKYIKLYQSKLTCSYIKTTLKKNTPYLDLLKITTIKTAIENINNLSHSKVLIYGYSYFARVIHELCKEKIVGFLDKQSLEINKKLVFHPDTLNSLEFDIIIIAVLNREKEITAYLSSLNVEKDKILNLTTLLEGRPK